MPFKDKVKRKAYIKEWQKQNPEKGKISRYKYLAKNPVKKLLKASRYNAKIRGLEHTIVEADIIIPKYCPYLEVELSYEVGSSNVISLDRIDNSKGYVPGNVQVISRLANSMKSNATAEQLRVFAKNVIARYKDLQ